MTHNKIDHMDCHFLTLFYFGIDLTRFPALEDCYEIFDELRLPGCPAVKIEDGNVHICASSKRGDQCTVDFGSGLVIQDKQIRYIEVPFVIQRQNIMIKR